MRMLLITFNCILYCFVAETLDRILVKGLKSVAPTHIPQNWDEWISEHKATENKTSVR